MELLRAIQYVVRGKVDVGCNEMKVRLVREAKKN